jgi:hypothetical protein
MDTSAEPTAIAADSLIAAVNIQHVDDASLEKVDDCGTDGVLMKIGFNAQM